MLGVFKFTEKEYNDTFKKFRKGIITLDEWTNYVAQFLVSMEKKR